MKEFTKEELRDIVVNSLKKYYKAKTLGEKKVLCDTMNTAISCIALKMRWTIFEARRYCGIDD